MPQGAKLEAVLRADAWMRRIARNLVGDLDAAEDLVQDAWVASLSKDRRDRPWLFGALRNLRRERARRHEREQRVRAGVEAPDGAPATDEVVSGLTLRKRVTDCLLGLREPYRTALYLRYVQGDTMPAIARQTGVAVSTVHARIQRGLELMRAELDTCYGNERRSWAIAFLALAEPTGPAAAVIGSVVMGTSSKVALAVVAGAGALAWIAAREPAADGLTPVVAAPAGETRQHEAPTVAGTDARAQAGREEAPRAEAGAQEAAAAPTGSLLAGRVLDMNAGGLTGVRVGYSGSRSSALAEAEATSGLGGRFELPAPDEADAAPRFECREPGYVTLVPGVESGGLWHVVVGRSARYSGVVVDVDERPIEGAQLTFAMRQTLFRELGIPRPFGAVDAAPQESSDGQGWFEFDALPGGPHVTLQVTADGYAPRDVELTAGGDHAMHVVLEVGANETVIEGLVLDPSGVGVPGAHVSAGADIVTTDAAGRFRLAWRLTGAGDHAQGADGVWRPRGDTSVLRATKSGFRPVEAPVAELDLDEPVVLRLGDDPLAIRGRVVDEHGAPRADIVVWETDPTAFGSLVNDSGGGKAVIRKSLEQLARGVEGVLSDADGSFELGGLLEREYTLRAYDPATGTRGGPWTIAAGANEAQLVLEAEPETGRVAGRVVTASGAPIPGVWLRPLRSSVFNDGTQPPWIDGVVYGVKADEEGRFEFAELATEGTILELQHELFFIRHFRLERAADLEDLEIVQAVLCELQVGLADPDFADRLQVLDAQGEPLELLESFGAFLGAGKDAQVENGRSNVLKVLESGRTLVLSKGDEEVLRRPIALDPALRLELDL